MAKIRVKIAQDKKGEGLIGKAESGKVYFLQSPLPPNAQEGDWWEGEVLKEAPRWGVVALTKKLSGKFTYRITKRYRCGHEFVEEKATFAPADNPPQDKVEVLDYACDACWRAGWEEQKRKEEEERRGRENAWLQIKETVLQMLLAPSEPPELASLTPPVEPQWEEVQVKRTIYEYEKQPGDEVVGREERMEWEPYKWELEKTTQMPGGEHGRVVKKVYLTIIRKEFKLRNEEAVRAWEERAKRLWESLPPAVRAYAAIKVNSCPHHAAAGTLCPNDTLYEPTADTHIPIYNIIFSPNAYLTLHAYAKRKPS